MLLLTKYNCFEYLLWLIQNKWQDQDEFLEVLKSQLYQLKIYDIGTPTSYDIFEISTPNGSYIIKQFGPELSKYRENYFKELTFLKKLMAFMPELIYSDDDYQIIITRKIVYGVNFYFREDLFKPKHDDFTKKILERVSRDLNIVHCMHIEHFHFVDEARLFKMGYKSFDRESHELFNHYYEPISLIHNDLHSNNIMIEDSGNVFFIDWEKATVGDVYFDIGSMIINIITKISKNYFTSHQTPEILESRIISYVKFWLESYSAQSHQKINYDKLKLFIKIILINDKKVSTESFSKLNVLVEHLTND